MTSRPATRRSLRHRIGGVVGYVLRGGRPPMSAARNSTSFAAGAIPATLITEVFDKIRQMPGWFNVDDCAHFSLILRMQTAMGVLGDVLEIGSYHGRSTCLLAYCLSPTETLHVCDAFERPGDEAYTVHPTQVRLWENLLTVSPRLSKSAVEIHDCYSTDLKLDESQRFRFVHVDGGHTKDVALNDLRLCAEHMLPSGIIAVDDYAHNSYPEVTEAVDAFLMERPGFEVLADLNRHGAMGRKIYLYSTGSER